MGYVFSMRAEYMYGMGKGLSWLPSGNFGKNTPWVNAGYIPIVESVYYNYKNTTQDLSLQGVFTLNNIRFHKSKTGFNIYGFAGFGGTIYDTKVNALGSNGLKYNFASITNSGVYKNRRQTIKALKALMDKTYESAAQNDGVRRPKLFGQTFRPSATFGAGVEFKLSNRVNLSIEDRWTILHDDLLDGQQWQEQPAGDAALTSNWDAYNYGSVGININLGSKSVEPLWWLNPLDYAYSEIRNPRLMRLPKPVLPDSDGDGITDQFDMEPNTPAGCPVDSHGVSRDTDGDGGVYCYRRRSGRAGDFDAGVGIAQSGRYRRDHRDPVLLRVLGQQPGDDGLAVRRGGVRLQPLRRLGRLPRRPRRAPGHRARRLPHYGDAGRRRRGGGRKDQGEGPPGHGTPA